MRNNETKKEAKRAHPKSDHNIPTEAKDHSTVLYNSVLRRRQDWDGRTMGWGQNILLWGTVHTVGDVAGEYLYNCKLERMVLLLWGKPSTQEHGNGVNRYTYIALFCKTYKTTLTLESGFDCTRRWWGRNRTYIAIQVRAPCDDVC